MQRRLDFDPNGAYVASRNSQFSGKAVAAGEVIPDGLIDPRRLRQLYEAGKIAPAEAGAKLLRKKLTPIPVPTPHESRRSR